tara:strand:+ start:136 stop:387 length:252 start_codon:yes stop_codon:yes gene_type:complete
MDEVETPNLTIDLTDEAMTKEVELKLTVGQLKLINEFLSQHIQPKGFMMIEFAYDLFKRLESALEGIEDKEEKKEAFTGTGDF